MLKPVALRPIPEAMRILLDETVVADSEEVIEVDGYCYFPEQAVVHSTLEASDFSSFCPHKGRAAYFHVAAGGRRALNAAFQYSDAIASNLGIRGRIAFYADVVPRPGHLRRLA